MVLIAKRACVIGAIGVIVGITLRRDVRGAVARGEMDVRFPRDVLISDDLLVLPFQWRPLFCPGNRSVLEKVRREANVSSTSLTHRARGLPLWSHRRIAWRRWTLVQQLACAPQSYVGAAWGSRGRHLSLPIKIPLG